MTTNPQVAPGPRPREQRLASRRQRQAAAAFVFLVDRDLRETLALKHFEVRGQRCAVHRQQGRNARHAGRLRPVQSVQQRKLTMRDVERPQRFVETARQRPRRPLHMQTQAVIADMQRRLKRFGDRN